jgi:small-conductance mechanosensitive channel
VEAIFKDLTAAEISWFLILLCLIAGGNFLLKKAAGLLAAKGYFTKERTIPAIRTVLNWLAFYGAVLLFLFYFSKEKWLKYPLYTHGDVDVSFFLILVAFMIVSLAHRLVKILTQYVLAPVYEYYRIDKGLSYTFNRIIYYSVMISALAVSLTSVGLDLTAIAAVLGVLGIGIGFGLRNVAGNFISGVIILFERPIEVGEVIQVDNTIGRVEKIRLRSTIIRTAKTGTLIVPNQYFIEQVIKNRTGAEMTAAVKVSVVYGTESRMVEELLQQAVKDVKQSSGGILEFPEAEVRFTGFHLQAMEFLVEIPVVDFEIKEQVESSLRHSISHYFRKNKIELPEIR